MDDDTDRDSIKAHFIRERGYWRPWTEALLRDNPRFLSRYATYAGHPMRTGPLGVRMVELIYVALDASATHLFGGGLRLHLEKALAAGATAADVFDVLHLVAAQGVDSVCHAVAILGEEIDAREDACEIDGREIDAGRVGRPATPVPVLESVPDSLAGGTAARHATARSRLEASGLPLTAAAIDVLARFDPGYLDVLADFMAQGRPAEGGLTDRERCLVAVALRGCFTGFDPVASRLGIRRALDTGCTAREILQCLQLGAHLAVHGTALGASAYAELRAGRG